MKTFKILNNISFKSVRQGLFVNLPSLVQITAWHWLDDKPESEPMMVLSTDAYMRRSASMS